MLGQSSDIEKPMALPCQRTHMYTDVMHMLIEVPTNNE